MEIARPNNWGSKKSWTGKSRRGMSTRTRRNIKVVKLGGGTTTKWWKLRVATPKLRLISPVKLWSKFKNAYMNLMSGHAKTISNAKQNHHKMSNLEFDNRLIYEIYKSLSVSMELRNP